jgi:hypothetical protein
MPYQETSHNLNNISTVISELGMEWENNEYVHNSGQVNYWKAATCKTEKEMGR